VAFIVVYDACVLFPPSLRDLLVRIAQTNIVRARWSEDILDECFRSIRDKNPLVDATKLQRTRKLMVAAVRDCMVEGYRSLVNSIELPDRDDRHVLAAAIRAGPQAIVTFNTKHFPSDRLSKFDLEAKHPDEFLVDLLDLDEELVARLVLEQAAALKNPAHPVDAVLDRLEKLAITRAVARLRKLVRQEPSGGTSHPFASL